MSSARHTLRLLLIHGNASIIFFDPFLMVGRLCRADNLPMTLRIFMFVLLTAAIWGADVYYTTHSQPQAALSASLAAVNGGDREASQLRTQDAAKDALVVLPWLLSVGALAVCFGKPMSRAAHQLLTSNSNLNGRSS